MPRVNREELLSQLECVQPGLSQKDIVQQTAAFIFQNGKVSTYNEEIACSHDCDLNVTGAVPADTLHRLLKGLPNKEIDIDVDGNRMIVRGGSRRKSGIRMDPDILPQAVEKPGTDWITLHERFIEAVDMAQECCGKDETMFWTVCVHMAPKMVEGSDNFQMFRYKLKTGLPQSVYVRARTIKPIIPLGMTKCNLTPNWIHFKNSGGLTISLHTQSTQIEDLTPAFEVTGEKLTIPKGIIPASEIAEIFSAADDKKSNEVMVKIGTGEMLIKGTGSNGYYMEKFPLQYSGQEFKFYLPTKLLQQISERHNECEVNGQHLKVDGGSFKYTTCLITDEDKAIESEKEEERDLEPTEDE